MTTESAVGRCNIEIIIREDYVVCSDYHDLIMLIYFGWMMFKTILEGITFYYSSFNLFKLIYCKNIRPHYFTSNLIIIRIICRPSNDF